MIRRFGPRLPYSPQSDEWKRNLNPATKECSYTVQFQHSRSCRPPRRRPQYRATSPVGTANLTAFPRALLLSHPATKQWHLIGTEWKEHVAWLMHIAITAVAVVAIRYARDLKLHPQLRSALLGFTAISLFAAGIAGFFGAMLDKNAPVDGGQNIQLVQGE
ncbi:MAG: hypothetical protein WAN35_15980 [Terracidiphilus sp.]